MPLILRMKQHGGAMAIHGEDSRQCVSVLVDRPDYLGLLDQQTRGGWRS